MKRKTLHFYQGLVVISLASTPSITLAKGDKTPGEDKTDYSIGKNSNTTTKGGVKPDETRAKTDFQDSFTDRLERAQKQIQELRAMAQRKGIDNNADVNEALTEVEMQRDHAEVALSDFKSASVAGWQNTSTQLDTAFMNLDKALEKANQTVQRP